MKFRPILAYVILGLCLSATLYLGASAISQTHTSKERRLPVTVKQLPLDNGVVPVEVSCDDAQVDVNKLERLSCTLRNNSTKSVTAAGVRVTILLEHKGKVSQDSGLLTVDSQWFSPDPSQSSLIPPAGTYRLEDLPSDYEDAVIRGVEVHLDYAEFADAKTVGPDSGTSQKVGEARSGAAKYRDWLSREFEKAGGSVESILPLLEKYQRLPPELEGEGGNQQEGASQYRGYLRRVFTTKGPEGLRNQLKKPPRQ